MLQGRDKAQRILKDKIGLISENDVYFFLLLYSFVFRNLKKLKKN